MTSSRILTVCLAVASLAGMAGSAYFYLGNRSLASQLETALAYRQQLQEQTERSTRQRLEFEQSLASLQDDLAAARSQLDSLSTALEDARQQASPDYQQLLEQARAEARQELARRQGPRAGGGLAALSNPDTAKALATRRTESYFQEFLSALQDDEAARETLVQYSTARYQALGDLLEGNLSPDQASAIFGPASLARALEGIVSDEQLAEALDLALQKDRNAANIIFGESLTGLGDSIDSATSQRILDTLLDEIYSEQNNYGALVAEDGSMWSAYQDQLDAYSRAREAMQDDLDPEQLAQFDRFLEDRSSGVDVLLEATTSPGGGTELRNARIGVDDLPVN